MKKPGICRVSFFVAHLSKRQCIGDLIAVFIQSRRAIYDCRAKDANARLVKNGRAAEAPRPPDTTRAAYRIRHPGNAASAIRYQLYDAPAPHVVAAELKPAPIFIFRFSRSRTDAPNAPA